MGRRIYTSAYRKFHKFQSRLISATSAIGCLL